MIPNTEEQRQQQPAHKMGAARRVVSQPQMVLHSDLTRRRHIGVGLGHFWTSWQGRRSVGRRRMLPLMMTGQVVNQRQLLARGRGPPNVRRFRLLFLLRGHLGYRVR